MPIVYTVGHHAPGDLPRTPPQPCGDLYSAVAYTMDLIYGDIQSVYYRDHRVWVNYEIGPAYNMLLTMSDLDEWRCETDIHYLNVVPNRHYDGDDTSIKWQVYIKREEYTDEQLQACDVYERERDDEPVDDDDEWNDDPY